MGQFDYLVPGSTATAPKSTDPVGGQFANLVPKATPVPVAPPVTPGPINRALAPVIGGIEKVGSDVFGALTAPPPNNISGPISLKTSSSAADDAALSAINTYANTFNDTTSRFSNAFSTVIDNHTSALQKGVAAGEAGIGALNLAFAPISAFLNGTSHIPVLGGLSQGLNNVFSAIGAGGSDFGEGAIDTLPVSNQTKATLMPLAKEIGALTAQIVAGKGSADTLNAVKGKTTDFMNTVHKAVLDSTGKPIEPNPITKLPVTGDTTPRPLPVADESIPTAVTPTNTETGQPIAPAAPEVAPAVSPDNITPAPSSSTAENGSTIPNTEVAPGEQTPTKVANDISDSLVNAGIAELTPEQKSTYTTGSYKDSAAQGEILKEQDPEALKQMAITGQNIPAGVHPQILFNIVDELAANTKDYALQRELAKSPLGTERSEHAAGLGSAGFNKVSDSPVDVIRRAVEKKAGGKEGTAKIAKEAAKAKSTITKAAAKMMDYQSIIDAIKTC